MRFPNRRGIIQLTAGVAALPIASGFAGTQAWAQAYPSKPVRVIVPFPAGNATDIVARLVGQSLSERLGQSFIIDNRPGAGGNIGTEAGVKAPPDGYTLLLISPSATISPALYKLNFNFLQDMAAVAIVGLAPYVVTLNPSFPAKTVPEFITYAKAYPGKINMASTGSGSASHLCGELLKSMAGIDMTHVPYRSSFLPDLLSGQVDVAFAPISLSFDQIRVGKLRALAVTTATRSEALPDVPTVAEFVPGYEASAWYGIGAPGGTSAEIVQRLNREINAGLADPKMKSRFADLGASVSAGSPAEFAKLLAQETEKWAKVIALAGIKPD
jgi:tripartite-type tricarboxylate transporter receptor subunit TctC